MKIAELGEDPLIELLTTSLSGSPNVIVGPGDDCAVIQSGKGQPYLLLKTDAVVEGVHFLRSQPAQKVGWKALARAISDVAAMGGTPQFALISLASPPDVKVGYWQKFYRGLSKVAREYGVTIVGGETTRSPGPIVVTVSLTGTVAKNQLVRRDGGRAGDWIFVTGRLGGSIRGKHLSFQPRVAEAAWLVRHFRPSAMMDLSDGLAKDLPRLAARSGVSFMIDRESLPRNRGCTVDQALGDGEDYELLFTVRPRLVDQIELAWLKQFPKIPLTPIGRLGPPSDVESELRGGFDHFRVA